MLTDYNISNALEPFIEHSSERALVQKALELAKVFAERASEYDDKNQFPFENFKDLISENFHLLTIPKQYGGKEISLTEFLLMQDALASGCGSTALGLGWHLGILFNTRYTKAWSEDRFAAICKEVIEHGYWLNSLSTEPATGSPTRGRRHETTAVRTENGWVINGQKTWSTLSPILDIFLVTAAIDGTDDLGTFLVRKGTPGLEVHPTWNSIGMRATGSHDVTLQNVTVESESLLEQHTYGKPSKKGNDGNGWLLHIPACYIGIAQAARNFAVHFASTYHPKGNEHPISQFPNVQEKIGRMEAELYAARSVLYHAARRWDAFPDERKQMQPLLGAAKYKATNQVIEIVDLAMRIVGGRSMFKQYPLERYYRDVRGGLHNPPMDDAVINLMAKRALGDEALMEEENRREG